MTDQRIPLSDINRIPDVRLSIRTKITVPYLILSIMLAVAAAYVITQLVTENVVERYNKQLFEAGKISSELLVGYETQLLETLRLLSNVEGVPRAILANDPGKLRSLSLGIIANDRQEAVEFLDVKGNHVLSIHHVRGGNPEDYEVTTGGQSFFSGLALVKEVLDQKSDARGDKFADLVTSESGDFLYVSGPVYDLQNELAGVILVGRSLPTLAEDIYSKTFAQISFYQLSGQMIFSSLPFSHNLTPELAAYTISHKNESSTTLDLSNQRNLTLVDIPFTEILGSWEVRGDHQIGVLGVALSKNSLVETSMVSRWRIFLLVAVTLLLVILLGFNLASAITEPLRRLVHASQKVAGGDLDIMVDPKSNDEISVLTESFNKMVASLNQSQKQLIQTYDETLEGWAKALELRDKETEGHSKRVTKLTVQLAAEMGVDGQALVNVRRGALLHDIGKMGTPDAILHKNGSLDPEEWQIIKQHPQDGYDLLKQIDYLVPALEIPLCHHEKWDGSGYPGGLKGEEIPIAARIFTVVDVFDAMTTDRPYRQAMPCEEVIQYLKDHSGIYFDPAVVDCFLRQLDLA